MANRSLGTLTVDLIAKVGGFIGGMDKAERETKRRADKISKNFKAMKLAITAATAAAVGSLAYLAKQSIDTADGVAKSSQQVGVSTDDYQSLGFAAELAGLKQENFRVGLRALGRIMGDFQRGSGEVISAYDAIGVSATDTNGELRDSVDVLYDVADAFASTPDGAGKTAIAMKLMGDQGARMIPLLNQGSAAIKDMQKQARDLGLVMDEQTLKAAEQFNDSLTVLRSVNEGVVNQITAEMLPTLNAMTGLLIDVSTETSAAKIAAESFGVILKSLASAAVIVGGTLATVSEVIGVTGAAIYSAAQGNFSQASKLMQQDSEALAKTFEMLENLWNGDYASAAQQAVNANMQLGDSLGYMSDEQRKAQLASEQGAKSIRDYAFNLRLQIVELEDGAEIVELMRLAVMGATDSELEYIKALREKLNLLKEQAELNVPGQDANLPGDGDARTALLVQEWLRTGEVVKETTDEMSVYADQAARNMQDAFADFLFDPFEDGLQGMLQSFADTLQRMAAEAAAAAIFDNIFGSEESGGGLGNFIAGIFGGQRAFGGPVYAGSVYEVGERGAEMFSSGGRQYMIPASSGRVDPISNVGGSTQVFNISTPNPDGFRSSKNQMKRMARRELIA